MLSHTKILTRTLIQSSYIKKLHYKQFGFFQKRWDVTSYINRKIHLQADKNVVISKHPDIVIPNCTVSDYIWKDLDNWADKTAMVIVSHIICTQESKHVYIFRINRFAVSLVKATSMEKCIN